MIAEELRTAVIAAEEFRPGTEGEGLSGQQAWPMGGFFALGGKQKIDILRSPRGLVFSY